MFEVENGTGSDRRRHADTSHPPTSMPVTRGHHTGLSDSVARPCHHHLSSFPLHFGQGRDSRASRQDQSNRVKPSCAPPTPLATVPQNLRLHFVQAQPDRAWTSFRVRMTEKGFVEGQENRATNRRGAPCVLPRVGRDRGAGGSAPGPRPVDICLAVYYLVRRRRKMLGEVS